MHFRHSEKNQDKQCFTVCNWAGKFLCPLLPWQRENTFLFCWYLGQGWWAQMQCLRELHFFPLERNIFVDPPIPLQLVITGRWGDCSTNELHPHGRNYYVQSIKGMKTHLIVKSSKCFFFPTSKAHAQQILEEITGGELENKGLARLPSLPALVALS